jgi:hypothetical protein
MSIRSAHAVTRLMAEVEDQGFGELGHPRVPTSE